MSKKPVSGRGRLKAMLAMLRLPGIRKDWLIAGVAGVVLGIFVSWAYTWWFAVQFTPHEVAKARNAARWAADNLEEYLRDSSRFDPRNRIRADGWRSYLRLNSLHYQLQSGAPPTDEDIETLAKIHDQFSGDHHGLELEQFVNVRRELGTYLKMLRLAQEPPDSPRQPPSEVASQWRSLRYR